MCPPRDERTERVKVGGRQGAMVAVDRDNMCRKEGFERLRDGERVRDEYVVRDMKRSYRKVSGETGHILVNMRSS